MGYVDEMRKRREQEYKAREKAAKGPARKLVRRGAKPVTEGVGLVAGKRASGGAVDHYNPAKGLKIVAIAEAAEKYYRRAKDVQRLYEAVEAKLTEQRKFVLWWDGQEKQADSLRRGNGAAAHNEERGLPGPLGVHQPCHGHVEGIGIGQQDAASVRAHGEHYTARPSLSCLTPADGSKIQRALVWAMAAAISMRQA